MFVDDVDSATNRGGGGQDVQSICSVINYFTARKKFVPSSPLLRSKNRK